MTKDFQKLNFKYELKDNEDNTQNLFRKNYQGSVLINEMNFGNICDIVEESRFRENFIKYLENTIKENEKFDRKNNCEWQGYNFYQEVLERLKSGKYE